MKRKRNVIKRNSGFLACCVLVAGASFGTANLVMEKGMVSLVMPSEEQTPEKTRETAPPEKSEKRVYETDAFTVTASGNIIKGVETEAPEKKETEKQTETDANGNPIGNGTQMNANGTDSVGNGAGSSGSGSDQDGSGNSVGNSSYDDTAGTDPGDSSWDNAGENAGNSSWDDYSGPSIVITDPGNGYYYYTDGSTWNGNTGSSSGGSTGGSSGGSSGGSTGGSSGGSTGGSTGGSSGGSSGGSTGDSSGGSSDNSDNIIIEKPPVSTPDDVILWGISSRYIDESELYNYNLDELCLIRNEIFALHGRMFRTPEIQEYFNGKSWYVPTYAPDDFDANMFDYLNDYEKANLQVILNYEAALAGN